jgi:outer membrane protein
LDLNASYLKENQAIPYIPAQAIDIPAKFSDEVYAWGVFLKFPLYEGGRLVGQIKVAELERMAQGLLKEMTLQDLISNVSNTFNKCLQMEALVQAYGLSVEALRKAREDMEARFRLGRVPQVEMLRMDVQLSAEEQNLVRAQEGLRRARNALAYFMGIETSKLGSLKGGLEAKERVAAADISHLVQARPDVSALTQRLQAERARLEVTKAKRYPSIGLVSDYGNRAGTGIRDREEVWEAGVVASVNLFDGGVISSEIARQQAVVAKAEEALRAGVLRATKEIEDALSSEREAEARIGLAENAVLQAKEALRIEELR